MNNTNLISSYNKYYEDRTHIHVYPVEFVVRTLLGTYPNIKMDRSNYAESKILDIGYGDGRNMPLLNNLKFRIHGLEISEEINRQGAERLAHLGIEAELKTGTNDQIPYENGYFDYILACHSCYYIKDQTLFDDNVKEFNRVLKSNGIFIASLPMGDNFIFKDAKNLSNGYFEIVNDPYGIREGTVHKTFEDKDEILKYFSPLFKNITIGHINDDYFGIKIKMWIVVATKK